MKSLFVDTLVANETVTAQFLVMSKEIRQKKTGEPYLTLHLADRTGEIEAKMWDNVSEVMHTFERDHFVKVKGVPQIYNNRSQLTIHKLRRLEDHEVEFADYFPCSERNPDEMFAELSGLIAGMRNPHFRSLLELIFSDQELTRLYKVAPAAKSIHHACRGGLLEHVLSLAALGRTTSAHYPEVDPDLLLTGIILHDIGKIEELSYDRSFGYSAEGQLLGHIVLGLRLLSSRFEKLPDFPAKLRTLVEHMVVSHHGELEFGSPKVPLFAEAMLLHHLDNLDSKMNAIRSILRRDAQGEGEFTGWIPSLERVLLRKERYLGEVVVKQSAPEATAKEDAEPAVPAAPPLSPAPPQAPPPISTQLVPAPALAAPLPVRKSEGHRSPANTLFGDKLQAVLEGRK